MEKSTQFKIVIMNIVKSIKSLFNRGNKVKSLARSIVVLTDRYSQAVVLTDELKGIVAIKEAENSKLESEIVSIIRDIHAAKKEMKVLRVKIALLESRKVK